MSCNYNKIAEILYNNKTINYQNINKDIMNDNKSDSYDINSNESDNECVICLENLSEDDIAILECGHYFHYKCVEKWLKKENCPTCRDGEVIVQIIENKHNEKQNDKNTQSQLKYKCFKSCIIC